MTEYKQYLISYRHGGAQWNIELKASSLDDARQRLSQLTFGKLEGEVIATVPGHAGPLVQLVAFTRNVIRRLVACWSVTHS
jgi:hypothetical protein